MGSPSPRKLLPTTVPSRSATTAKTEGSAMNMAASCVATRTEGKSHGNRCSSAIPLKASKIMRPHGSASAGTADRIVTVMPASGGRRPTAKLLLNPAVAEHPHRHHAVVEFGEAQHTRLAILTMPLRQNPHCTVPDPASFRPPQHPVKVGFIPRLHVSKAREFVLNQRPQIVRVSLCFNGGVC